MARNIAKFKWNKQREIAAECLAEGYTIRETSKASGLGERTISRLKVNEGFATEVDKLTCMMGIASRAERLRIIKQIVRKQLQNRVQTKKDVLDWLKYAQSETDGIKLGFADEITEILEAINK